MLRLLTVFCLASGVFTSNLPCEYSDQACIEKLINTVSPKILSGIPELDVPSSDPLFVDKIEGNLSVLKYNFFNSTFTGYKDCTVTNPSINEDLTKIKYDLNCDKVKSRGTYELLGRLVIMAVEGKGDYNMVAGKYIVNVESDLKKVEENGKTYITIKNIKIKCIPLTGSRFDFKNLFNGRKDLSDAIHNFAHQNWEEVAYLVQDPIWYAIMKKVTVNINKYLKQVAIEDILTN